MSTYDALGLQRGATAKDILLGAGLLGLGTGAAWEGFKRCSDNMYRIRLRKAIKKQTDVQDSFARKNIGIANALVGLEKESAVGSFAQVTGNSPRLGKGLKPVTGTSSIVQTLSNVNGWLPGLTMLLAPATVFGGLCAGTLGAKYFDKRMAPSKKLRRSISKSRAVKDYQTAALLLREVSDPDYQPLSVKEGSRNTFLAAKLLKESSYDTRCSSRRYMG